ncbi:putative F-box protein PP2-B12 [Lycium barbarum]|uniref:putative F-box protein PP2-B12 n=1 Tax=Lycium barbarum TaxID=112863 RepID=UPI00293F03C9|nr:putative F-box protein PP2-B12 [Lycium barbarum]
MEENGENEKSSCLWMLPEGCIAEILGLTSPLDVCRLSLVCKSVQFAAESDAVWKKFLPSDYQSIIAGSLSPIPDFRSKKDLYVYLCHHSLLIDGGRKSFSLDKWTGKKCYFLGARDLNIAWGDTPEHWTWTCLPESRFPEVAKLEWVCWLEIWGTIRAGSLSPFTSYVAYLVYKLENKYGFDYRPSEVSVGIPAVESETRFAFLDPNVDTECEYEEEEESCFTPPCDRQCEGPYWRHDPNLTFSDIQHPKLRDDGWFEIELGEFYTENEDDCIELRMHEVKAGISKQGLIVEGIEIRPRIR